MRILRILRILTFLTILSANFLFLGRTASVSIVRPKSRGRSRFNEREALSLRDLLADATLVVRCIFVRHYRECYLLPSN